jgi:hypothetical protein
LIFAGLGCFALVLFLTQQCGPEDWKIVLGVLGVLGGSVLFAVAAFLYVETPSRRWVPWVAALATFMLVTVGFSFLAGAAVVGNCSA